MQKMQALIARIWPFITRKVYRSAINDAENARIHAEYFVKKISQIQTMATLHDSQSIGNTKFIKAVKGLVK